MGGLTIAAFGIVALMVLLSYCDVQDAPNDYDVLPLWAGGGFNGYTEPMVLIFEPKPKKPTDEEVKIALCGPMGRL